MNTKTVDQERDMSLKAIRLRDLWEELKQAAKELQDEGFSIYVQDAERESPGLRSAYIVQIPVPVSSAALTITKTLRFCF